MLCLKRELKARKQKSSKDIKKEAKDTREERREGKKRYETKVF